jgi:hypothetical protein
MLGAGEKIGKPIASEGVSGDRAVEVGQRYHGVGQTGATLPVPHYASDRRLGGLNQKQETSGKTEHTGVGWRYLRMAPETGGSKSSGLEPLALWCTGAHHLS